MCTDMAGDYISTSELRKKEEGRRKKDQGEGRG
jgi:hypothetical protein